MKPRLTDIIQDSEIMREQRALKAKAIEKLLVANMVANMDKLDARSEPATKPPLGPRRTEPKPWTYNEN
jgi:hypothetical protein